MKRLLSIIYFLAAWSIVTLRAHPVSVSYGSVYIREQGVEIDLIIQAEDFFFFEQLLLDRSSHTTGVEVTRVAGLYRTEIRKHFYCLDSQGDTLRGELLQWELVQTLPPRIHVDSLEQFQINYRLSFAVQTEKEGIQLYQCFGGLRSPIQAMSFLQVFPDKGMSYPLLLAKGTKTHLNRNIQEEKLKDSPIRSPQAEVNFTIPLIQLNYSNGHVGVKWEIPVEMDLGKQDRQFSPSEENSCVDKLEFLKENIFLETQSFKRLLNDTVAIEIKGNDCILGLSFTLPKSEQRVRLVWKSFTAFRKIPVRSSMSREIEDVLLTRYKPLAILNINNETN